MADDTTKTEDRPSLRASVRKVRDTSDKAKTEAVRMIGREVRHYLEGLGLRDDLHHLLTNYRLEVKASFHLEPLAKHLEEPEEEPANEEAPGPPTA